MNQKKILMVEDDKSISKAYFDGLKNAGFEVISAENGDVAIDELNRTIPDIILLDILLPGKNGYEVLGYLKKNEAFKQIPVIVVSNLDLEVDFKVAKDLGANECLVKSNTGIVELVSVINKYFK